MSLDNTIEKYAQGNYEAMLREPEGILRHKFIVPGSIYENQLWDWDCWLTNVALKQFVKEDISEYEKGCILNFLDHIDEKGRVPIVILPDRVVPENSNSLTNIHKPCLAQHAAFIIKHNNDTNWIKDSFPKILRFVDYYMGNCRHDNGLYFWMNDLSIGVDNDPCTFYRPDKSSASIFLNCLMYKELEAVCYIGELLDVDIEKYQKEKDNLRSSIQQHCFDEKDSFFYSVDLNLLPINLTDGLHAGAPREWDCLIQRIGVWSGFMAMWCGIATSEQAKKMVENVLCSNDAFWAPCGIRTLAKYEKMYSVKATSNPSCWLGPVWIVSNYMVFRGLVKYGYVEMARELAEKTVNMLEMDIKCHGGMHEYYDPETGQPIVNLGFQNWNLLAINMRAWLNGKPVVEEF